MSKTLFDLTYELARALGVVEEGTATGGSTTTIADTNALLQADDFWNNGTAWILYDAGGLGAAPQGEYSVISDFAQSGGLVTLRSTLTAAVGIGDKYAVARTRYSLSLLIQKVNEALTGVVIEKTDITTVAIADSQTEYSLPSDLIELKEVWLAANTDDTDDNRWERVFDWTVQKSATGTANKVVFTSQYGAGIAVKLTYLAYHANLRIATDKLDDSIHINKIIYQAAVGCILQRKAKVGESDPALNDLLNYYQNLANRMDAEHAVELPKKSAKTISLRFSRP
jgi:hypothetical protein